jgi:hypothetical protein
MTVLEQRNAKQRNEITRGMQSGMESLDAGCQCKTIWSKEMQNEETNMNKVDCKKLHDFARIRQSLNGEDKYKGMKPKVKVQR